MASNPDDKEEVPFWRRKTLNEMTDSEWESLCDGCARCCLNKLVETKGAKRTFYTDVRCLHLDEHSCRCRNYEKRDFVEGCAQLTPENLENLKTDNWLPPSCAYVLVAEGRDLYWWHPLVSGDPETVHQAGVSVRGRTRGSELEVPVEGWGQYIVNWPMRLPKRLRRPG